VSDTATSVPAPVQRPRALRFEWLLPVLIRPRQGFASIVEETRGIWLTPILLLMGTSIVRVIAAGVTRAPGELSLPPGFEYYSPEQQAQFMQAAQATSGPVFVYVFPAIIALLSVWVGWLIASGVVHFVLTIQGGRGTTLRSANVVAWAGLPFAVRDIVRFAAMLIAGQPIASPGLSGFITPDAPGIALFAASLLALVDLYILWHIVLVIVGMHAAEPDLPVLRVVASVSLVMLILLALQAGAGFAGTQLQRLTVTQPFFF